jgi:hypothetical protein
VAMRFVFLEWRRGQGGSPTFDNLCQRCPESIYLKGASGCCFLTGTDSIGGSSNGSSVEEV